MRILFVFIIIIITWSIDFFTKVYFEKGYWLYECNTEVLGGLWQELCNSLKYNYFPLIDSYIGVQLTFNTGIAFSLPIPTIILQALTLILIVTILYYYTQVEYVKKSSILDTGYAMILGGAISHAIERITKGQVLDFIAVKYFAIFNFADIFISLGVMIIIIYYFLYDRGKNPKTSR